MTITRNLDSLNRLVFPKRVNTFGWTEKTELDMTVLDGIVTVTAHAPYCRLCGDSSSPLIEVGNGNICQRCLEAANQINES